MIQTCLDKFTALKLNFEIFSLYVQPVSELADLESFTVKTFEHVPYSFCFCVKGSFDESLSKLAQYRGSDAVEGFCRTLEEHALHVYNEYMKEAKEMKSLSDEEQNNFDYAEFCHICEKRF